jgi:hypothetical protein
MERISIISRPSNLEDKSDLIDRQARLPQVAETNSPQPMDVKRVGVPYT